MTTSWLTTTKPTFQTEWLALPPKEAHQILEKIAYLTKDPHPDGNLKKQLTKIDRRLHRLESGNYRIIYTFEQPYISLLALRRRREDTYDEDFQAEYLGGLDLPLAPTTVSDTDTAAQTITEEKPYPEPLTKDLLINLLIPAEYHPRLLQTTSQEQLLDCPGVPDEYKLKIDTHMFEKPLVRIFEEKDYLLPEVNDLLRFKKGELLGFLLKLSPEQEKYANWGLQASGPTLLKGGPGTGKSTIALYRVRAIIEALRKQGKGQTKILFTTYTNALVKSSEQLLEQLLGADIQYVQVQTVDKIITQIAEGAGQRKTLATQSNFDELLLQALQELSRDKSVDPKNVQQLERIGVDYLQQEIRRVIIAGQINTLADYQATPRPGRKLPLSAGQRQLIWQLHEILQKLLEKEGKELWEGLRARVERIVADGQSTLSYDAVIIDEAQDLDPSALRLLVQLCRNPNKLFITADANQSIYGSHFNWSQIHHELQFRGRTAILHTNYRSTQEIGEAAQSYLAQEVLDNEPIERHYTYHGPLPTIRKVFNDKDEAQLLASFLTGAARSYKLPIDACAILCPSEKIGRAIASALKSYALEATFMSGQYLSLTQPGIKILTLNSAKGLEFPIVALAGLHKSAKYVQKPEYATREELTEAMATERRLLFVGMTRAMRALLVAIPDKSASPLMAGFVEEYWNR
ncbi:3'-5' exonuclease [Tengunoibacter tsumagoiensis]|uniref:DNA 3'-5' helicase n=1 Tax=Tengunoibacter tsumagoiensis TaxID=2014871 RepID=A0A402A0A1_9CHLR|nr:3'-5' exonuclease [Tengunoibacter tsumagoiensis]GCE12482.1 DNA helicase [Tengunoibacter tsumagoiensis]